MGVQDVLNAEHAADCAAFRQSLLIDLMALEQMLDGGVLEADIARIGVEQEMLLVDRAYRPAPINSEVLARLADLTFTTEIGKFNLEANLPPRKLEGDCLRSLEAELTELVRRAAHAARELDCDVLLTGILPSARVSDLGLHNLTDKPRYRQLNRAVMGVRGGSYQVFIKGTDELHLVHDNVMPEACCTSFQLHVQLDPRQFARQYNASLLAAAPVLAAAVNSPMLLGKRLWHETRIALFQHAVDERTHSHIARSHPTRVSFGDCWVTDSVLEILREQIARFRIIMTSSVEENSLETLQRGGIPSLKALVLHNSTVWRWNRPCYGITDGRPHLRLEFRALPAGPTVIDEVANAAFFLGLVLALPEQDGNVADGMRFDDAKDNFFSAARYGLKAQLTWFGGRTYSVKELINGQLLGLASRGLKQAGIDAADIDKYLGLIHDRLEAGQTGSNWMLSSAASMNGQVSTECCDRVMVAAMLARQKSGCPVHEWAPVSAAEKECIANSRQTVGEIMSTDLFTVSPDDPVTLAATLMDWRHIRHLPVEENGRLAGLISSREVFHLIAAAAAPARDPKTVLVGEVMNQHPLTVRRDTLITEALQLMLDKQSDCLPVTAGDELIGIVTSQDMLRMFAAILKKQFA